MYLCYQYLPGIYKPPVLSELFIHRPASALTTLLSKTSPTPQDLSVPPPAALGDIYERILLLEVLERHQELLYHCSWLSHAQSTAAVPVPPRSCPPRRPQLFLDVLPKCRLRTYYPSAHPRTCYPSTRYTHAPELPKLSWHLPLPGHRNFVLVYPTTLRTCYPSAHPRTCYPSARYAYAP